MCALYARFRLIQHEKEIFHKLLLDNSQSKSNVTSEEWKPVRGWADGRSIVIKQAYKGSCVVVWDLKEYIKEAENQFRDKFQDKSVHKGVDFKETILPKLVEKSNKFFKKLCSQKCLTENFKRVHYVKSAQIQNFFWSVFSCIRTEHGYLRSKSPYSVRIQENKVQKNSVFGLFSRSG